MIYSIKKTYFNAFCRCKKNDRGYYKEFVDLMNIKIFCDIADISLIKKFNKKNC